MRRKGCIPWVVVGEIYCTCEDSAESHKSTQAKQAIFFIPFLCATFTRFVFMQHLAGKACTKHTIKVRWVRVQEMPLKFLLSLPLKHGWKVQGIGVLFGYRSFGTFFVGFYLAVSTTIAYRAPHRVFPQIASGDGRMLLPLECSMGRTGGTCVVHCSATC